jgi:hypothetical protein
VRLPEVFVRRSAHAEATLLKSRVKKAKHFATRERAAILRALNVGISVSQIVAMWMTDERHVRRIIDEFNERGMASLNPEYRRRASPPDRRRSAQADRCGRRCLSRHPRGRVDVAGTAEQPRVALEEQWQQAERRADGEEVQDDGMSGTTIERRRIAKQQCRVDR